MLAPDTADDRWEGGRQRCRVPETVNRCARELLLMEKQRSVAVDDAS
jgi:hypothetical protein